MDWEKETESMLRSLRILHDRRGATAIEYSLIAALMAVAVIAAFAVLGPALEGIFTDIAGQLTLG